MKLVDITCPHCGGRTRFIKGTKAVKCEYCDSVLLVDDSENASLKDRPYKNPYGYSKKGYTKNEYAPMSNNDLENATPGQYDRNHQEYSRNAVYRDYGPVNNRNTANKVGKIVSIFVIIFIIIIFCVIIFGFVETLMFSRMFQSRMFE